MALWLFAEAGVDWAVMETGMGGRLDATNVLCPRVCVISNVSLEHQEWLGSTIAKIAREKAGIIKPGTPVVTGASQRAALAEIVRTAREKSAPLLIMGRDFNVRRQKNNSLIYRGPARVRHGLFLPLAGEHQLKNAACALAACEVLQENGAVIPEKAVYEGLACVRWPGRLETVHESPRIILDGAHNMAGMRSLTNYLRRKSDKNKLIAIAGFSDDKPYARMLSMLLPLAKRAVLTRADIGRALVPQKLKAAAASLGRTASAAESVSGAVEKALKWAGRDDTIIVTGSLFVVGEARQYLEGTKKTGPGFSLLGPAPAGEALEVPCTCGRIPKRNASWWRPRAV
jgi:dihydrofolate synthase/folylpolyglutamate synthase